MFTFHWPVEYVMSLPYPVFMELTVLVGRVRADSAIEIDFSAYCAGKYGKGASEDLFEARGSFYLDRPLEKASPKLEYTAEDLEAAKRRALKLASHPSL